MAPEPKGGRKRATKKTAARVETPAETKVLQEVIDSAPVVDAEEKPKRAKKAAVPVPVFQAAPIAEKPAKATKSEKAPVKKVAKKAAPSTKDEDLSEGSAPANDDSPESAERRRRRRGGRGRRRPGDRTDSDNSSESSVDEGNDESDAASDDSSDENADGTPNHRRRRRRRARGTGAEGGATEEIIDEDGVKTVVKVREPREARQREERNDRGNRRDRNDRGRDRHNRRDREPREFVRRRGTIITEGEFLARRENVDRVMLVRQTGDRTQIAVLEDKIMVEHYVNRNSNISYVGNVYLGKVQNVLPSMEAAFVDIGKGRNAVLYAGEVNWDAAGMAESANRKIEHVLKTGQSVLVQVTKDPIGQKGARLTSQISLPGRYLVYIPSGEMSGISRRLPDQERSRLKSILKGLVPEEAGVIVRTASEGASEEELANDVTRLKAQWEEIQEKAENPSTSAPSLLYAEPDLTVRVIRDIFNEDFNQMIVQGDQAWEDIDNYLGGIAPELKQKIEKWVGPRDLFAEHRIEEQLAKAFDRKVYLPSGGSLVIDRTEAMVVIDVNTGKFVGKGGNLEETVTKNNLEAAEEIARQLRLRDLGGIVVIDFIDMALESNRDQVLRRLVECLGRDRTKHQVAEVTSLGLVQMTRKRIGQGLIEAFSTTCESCGGRGIHIHTEPVRKVALDKDMDQKFVPSQTENYPEVSALPEAATSEESEVVEPVATLEKTPRKRRRAVSTGIITPE
jgi:Rne/Rng family ribonuclease